MHLTLESQKKQKAKIKTLKYTHPSSLTISHRYDRITYIYHIHPRG